MDCVECTQHVRRALEALPGVETAKVSLSAEKAYVSHQPGKVGLAEIRQAFDVVVERSGLKVMIEI